MSGTGVKWTREQQQVIESRGKNLLVSAAAGSGKTALLVERIIRMVTEGEHPLDIDQLLVMTFTNAAAAEMRERIGAAIEARLLEEPDNEHLQIQSALIHHAQITTIDSFCLHVIREHFNQLDLDPSFRIGDEGELMLLRADVMEELLEDFYENGGERFERFVETFGQGKSDAGIEDHILQVYTFSQSNPYPDQWLARCRKELGMEAGDSGEGGSGGAGKAGDQEQPEQVERRQEQKERRQEQKERRQEQPAAPAWMGFLLSDARKQLKELAAQMEESLELCREDEYLCAYEPMLANDVRQLSQAAEAGTFEELYEELSGITWDRLAAVRSKEVDAERKASVTGCRDRVKKAAAKLRDLYCFAPPQEMAEDMKGTAEAVEVLLELAEEFDRRFQEKKRERNLVDFNDLEHQALKVLLRWEDGAVRYTDAADELSAQFEEVLVDEYQDSNLVQEALLNAVSRERFGRDNVFMVGDVKQSIYRFRLARPELFLEKYTAYEPYETGGGTKKKIELHQNFRSRDTVLSAVNDVFYRIMSEDLGDIRYTEDAALHPGASFAEIPEEAFPKGRDLEPELLAVDTGAGALDGLEEDAAEFTAREIEARLIAARIREMTDPERGVPVWDKTLNGTGGYRTARLRDMVILLRSTAGWTEAFLSVLMNEGIPAYAESRTGYFNTMEVETVLSFLSVLDNPMQDIPLAAALRSPIGGLSDEELARLMGWYRGLADKGEDRGIYGAMQACLAAGGRGQVLGQEQGQAWGQAQAQEAPGELAEIQEKLRHFQTMTEDFRRRSLYLPIHELLYRIYEETGYYRLASAMPAGETRKANLDMLVEKAVEYERTSYKGLFHFVRYVENLKKYNSDFGEASSVGEEDDTVRIMSIHKSKGLEFPIVFLAGMGKRFNRQDVYGKLLIDPELGIATDYLDLEHRLKTTTLKKNVLRRKMELDSLGEELRVLYVAMTRAKERLIMTGTDRSLAKSLEKYAHVPLTDGHIPYTILGSANSYLDWILMSMGAARVRIAFREVPLTGLIGEAFARQARGMASKEELLRLPLEEEYDGPFREALHRNLDYRYPYEADIRLYTKMSVSELKKQGQLTDEAESMQMAGPLGPELERQYREDGQADGRQDGWQDRQQDRRQDSQRDRQDAPRMGGQPGSRQNGPGSAPRHAPKGYVIPGIPDLPPDGGAGAARGTACHRAMELLPFHQMHCREDVERYLEDLTEEGRFTRENLERTDVEEIWGFLQSELGRRMALAQAEGRLHKEQQFVIGIPAREMGAGDSEELVLIQGIIDAYFEEEDGLVLVDYKTDRVSRASLLTEHYQTQLQYYARALTQMTGKPVRQRLIYSLTLQQEIPC